jgi:hypothetical protein
MSSKQPIAENQETLAGAKKKQGTQPRAPPDDPFPVGVAWLEADRRQRSKQETYTNEISSVSLRGANRRSNPNQE